ncbi:MAG: hypothetical protein OIF58_07295, partial [Cohaesibacter sp.]|nr:hypothetical protein [Cohaesibacter sp.]
MGVVPVVGDGDCLFHALASFDGSDGGALRIDVADFMEQEAINQPGFEFEWLDEAEKLRENKWGGHTAIIAFSQMMAARVVLHTRLENGAVTVTEASHRSVAETAPVRHILYNNSDHYDALIEVADASGMEAAWPQPPPPRYVKETVAESEFPPLPDSRAETQAPKPKRHKFSAARPPKISKKKPLNLKKAFNDGQCCGGEEGAEAAQDQQQKQWRHRRYTQKTTPPPELRDDILTEMCRIQVARTSEHPHRQQEDLIKDDIRMRVFEHARDKGVGIIGSSSLRYAPHGMSSLEQCSCRQCLNRHTTVLRD